MFQMDADLVALTSTAASTAVTLLVTDGWERVTAGIASLWSRVHSDRPQVIEGELLEARAVLLEAQHAGDVAVVEDLIAEWRGRLRRLVEADADAITDLRHLVTTVLEPALAKSGARGPSITMTAEASDRSRIYQAGRDQHIGGEEG
ncbi:hypothetical protein ACFRAO_00190 [Streptomyces sp. NPDC056656]|uniref:hypothetical protein n=1 Tax=Streptomyces sp. NPDC056656 TaxID=3345895 RepID=UPI0036C42997